MNGETHLEPGNVHVLTTLDRIKATQWTRHEYGGGPGALTPEVIYECVSCRGDRAEGHRPGCPVAELILELEAKETEQSDG